MPYLTGLDWSNGVLGQDLARLLAEPKLLNDLFITTHFVSFEVLKQATPTADKFQQASAGGVILFVRLEMLSQVSNSFTEYRDLNFGRPRIRRMDSILVDDRAFGFRRQSHSLLSFLPQNLND